MVTKLDYSIWKVGPENDSLIGGAVEDLTDGIKHSVNAATNVIAPSLALPFQNTSKFLRNPNQAFKNWGFTKFFKSFPAAGADIATKVMSLPFRTLEGALTYWVANNVERIVWTAKGLTTDAARNWFRNGENSNMVMKWMGNLIGWSWDIVWSVTKAAPWLLQWLSTFPNDYVFWPAIRTTQEWVENQKLEWPDMWTPKFTKNTINSPVNNVPNA
jgi:hypothetical protein